MEQKIHFFAFDLPHSDASFVQAYPEETTEAFCAGHSAAFELLRRRAAVDPLRQSMDASRGKVILDGVVGLGARIYPACCWSDCAPGHDGSPPASS